MAPAVSAGADERSDAALDARMLTELRQWVASPSVIAKRAAGGDAFLSWDEIDMLLRVADDRDAIRRELCEMPDDVTLAPKLAVVRYDSCGIASGCGGDEVCAALCPSRRGA